MVVFAMVFPGQGSQTVGMLTKLSKIYMKVKETFSEASDVLGYDLWQLVQRGPTEKLNQTEQTQPALLATSVAIWRIWQEQNGNIPAFMAGHSLGEYSALVCSGSLDFITGIKIVALRGTLMQNAAPVGTGAMAAIIGLDNDIVTLICKQSELGRIVSPVNFNYPGQVVIAGHKDAVERASISCKKAGAKRVLSLSVSVPSHCALMKPAEEKLAQALNAITFDIPKIPVINNVNARIENNPTAIRQALIYQLCNPVRWTETIEHFNALGVKRVLELGPGNILTKLNKRIISTLISIAVNDPTSLATAISKQN
ncbi:ACP S-malonyltransferase [Candidatus Curculioniphilus buchneri]|uniref:ACP S-malonyltransferase n=1 Tax=Candidatus Curculioniphilus buchneri TaxID=690594 RepID=UPI00376F0F02